MGNKTKVSVIGLEGADMAMRVRKYLSSSSLIFSSSGSGGGAEGRRGGHEKDSYWRRPHRFHVSRPRPTPPTPPRHWIRYCFVLFTLDSRSLFVAIIVQIYFTKHKITWLYRFNAHIVVLMLTHNKLVDSKSASRNDFWNGKYSGSAGADEADSGNCTKSCDRYQRGSPLHSPPSAYVWQTDWYIGVYQEMVL